MMYGFSICNDSRSALSKLKDLRGAVRSASVECPDALTRNASFLRGQLEDMREEIAAIEAKLPKPEVVDYGQAA